MNDTPKIMPRFYQYADNIAAVLSITADGLSIDSPDDVMRVTNECLPLVTPDYAHIAALFRSGILRPEAQWDDDGHILYITLMKIAP